MAACCAYWFVNSVEKRSKWRFFPNFHFGQNALKFRILTYLDVQKTPPVVVFFWFRNFRAFWPKWKFGKKSSLRSLKCSVSFEIRKKQLQGRGFFTSRYVSMQNFRAFWLFCLVSLLDFLMVFRYTEDGIFEMFEFSLICELLSQSVLIDVSTRLLVMQCARGTVQGARWKAAFIIIMIQYIHGKTVCAWQREFTVGSVPTLDVISWYHIPAQNEYNMFGAC